MSFEAEDRNIAEILFEEWVRAGKVPSISKDDLVETYLRNSTSAVERGVPRAKFQDDALSLDLSVPKEEIEAQFVEIINRAVATQPPAPPEAIPSAPSAAEAPTPEPVVAPPPEPEVVNPLTGPSAQSLSEIFEREERKVDPGVRSRWEAARDGLKAKGKTPTISMVALNSIYRRIKEWARALDGAAFDPAKFDNEFFENVDLTLSGGEGELQKEILEKIQKPQIPEKWPEGTARAGRPLYSSEFQEYVDTVFYCVGDTAALKEKSIEEIREKVQELLESEVADSKEILVKIPTFGKLIDKMEAELRQIKETGVNRKELEAAKRTIAELRNQIERLRSSEQRLKATEGLVERAQEREQLIKQRDEEIRILQSEMTSLRQKLEPFCPTPTPPHPAFTEEIAEILSSVFISAIRLRAKRDPLAPELAEFDKLLETFRKSPQGLPMMNEIVTNLAIGLVPEVAKPRETVFRGEQKKIVMKIEEFLKQTLHYPHVVKLRIRGPDWIEESGELALSTALAYSREYRKKGWDVEMIFD